MWILFFVCCPLWVKDDSWWIEGGSFESVKSGFIHVAPKAEDHEIALRFDAETVDKHTEDADRTQVRRRRFPSMYVGSSCEMWDVIRKWNKKDEVNE